MKRMSMWFELCAIPILIDDNDNEKKIDNLRPIYGSAHKSIDLLIIDRSIIFIRMEIGFSI